MAPGARLGGLRRALILRGTAGHHAFTEDVVRDPAIGALCKVTVREDPELNAGVPRLKSARVTVTFTDGRQVTRLREGARGDFQDPYREDEIRRKFRELAHVVLSPSAGARVEELVDRLDGRPASPISSPPSRAEPGRSR